MPRQYVPYIQVGRLKDGEEFHALFTEPRSLSSLALGTYSCDYWFHSGSHVRTYERDVFLQAGVDLLYGHVCTHSFPNLSICR